MTIPIDPKQLMAYVKQGLDDMKKEHVILNEPVVKVLADSVSSLDHSKRLITFECIFWRAILPELTRHRTLSLTVRSSRATPSSLALEEVKTSPWGPKEWGMNQKGMTAAEQIAPQLQSLARYIWYSCAANNVKMAEQLVKMEVHKQVVNRLLEPYMCTHVVVSGTEWDNFFKLRISDEAQPEMRDLAVAMKEAMNRSTPTELLPGQWHMPYISEEERKVVSPDDLRLVSAARCARVSYKAFDGSTSIEKDLELAKKLLTNGHMSPFEAVATPCTEQEYRLSNFKGWNQLRKFVE